MNKFLLYGIQVIIGLLATFVSFLLGLINGVTVGIFAISLIVLIGTKYKLAPIIFYLSFAASVIIVYISSANTNPFT